MAKVKLIRALLGLMSVSFILVVPNITLHEWLYIATFAVGAFLFRKNRSWLNCAVIVIFVSCIFQLNDFAVPVHTEIKPWYWPVNITANIIHTALFLAVAGIWTTTLDGQRIKRLTLDDLGMAVLVSAGILTFYFCLRFVFIEFNPRELLFVWQIFDGSIMFFILRDVLFLDLSGEKG